MSLKSTTRRMSFNPPAVEPEDPPIVIHAVVKSFRVGAQRHHDEAYTEKITSCDGAWSVPRPTIT